jgi:hypothetical protein
VKTPGTVIKLLAVLAIVVVTTLGVWSYWPAKSFDLSRVCPQLLSLQKPYQSIKTVYFLDGGSIGIEIVDRNNMREQFALPIHLDGYKRVFVGGLHDRQEGAIEIADPEATKHMLIGILRDCPMRNAQDDACLMHLRRRPIDIVRVLIHKLRGDYQP